MVVGVCRGRNGVGVDARPVKNICQNRHFKQLELQFCLPPLVTLYCHIDSALGHHLAVTILAALTASAASAASAAAAPAAAAPAVAACRRPRCRCLPPPSAPLP